MQEQEERDRGREGAAGSSGPGESKKRGEEKERDGGSTERDREMGREGTEKHRDRLDQKHNSAVVAWAQNGRARLVPREGSSAPVRPRAGRATCPYSPPGAEPEGGGGAGDGREIRGSRGVGAVGTRETAAGGKRWGPRPPPSPHL